LLGQPKRCVYQRKLKFSEQKQSRYNSIGGHERSVIRGHKKYGEFHICIIEEHNKAI
jgi:hypothetical protein